jgi:hypothetical protein
MAFSLLLPSDLTSAGWKLKIRDQEGREDPHITFIRGTTTYRWNLRTRDFMDRKPDPGDVPDHLVEIANNHHGLLVLEWARMYPENPC